MERLQAAINKARALRGEGGKPHGQRRYKKGQSPEEIDALWDGLRHLNLTKRTIKRNRLVSLQDGEDSASFDMLRTRILQQAKVNDWKRVAFVSPDANCGKTTIVANLAYSLSRQPELRTIVMDLDFRRIGLGKLLNQKAEYTMADVLTRKVKFRHHALCAFSNVAMGLNGKAISGSSEILQSEGTSKVLNSISEDFQPNLMLFDMPPLMTTDDNFGFLRNVDCAILVAEAGKTTINQIDLAEQQLSELTNVMGTVLNKTKYMSGSSGYDYDRK